MRHPLLLDWNATPTEPELQAGDWVEVTVEAVNATVEPKITVAELIDSLQGHRFFQTAEEEDAYLREERDSWDD